MFYVYIIKSEKTKTYYVGSTNNLYKRMEEHNSGRSKYTSRGIPWELIYYESYSTRSLAMKKEKVIKSRGIKRYLEYMDIS